MDSIQRYLLHKGDVLFTEGGDFDKLGRGAIWEKQIDPCLHQNHIFSVRCNETLKQKLAALEKQKRGLMQKLLTGEIRVKT